MNNKLKASLVGLGGTALLVTGIFWLGDSKEEVKEHEHDASVPHVHDENDELPYDENELVFPTEEEMLEEIKKKDDEKRIFRENHASDEWNAFHLTPEELGNRLVNETDIGLQQVESKDSYVLENEAGYRVEVIAPIEEGFIDSINITRPIESGNKKDVKEWFDVTDTIVSAIEKDLTNYQGAVRVNSNDFSMLHGTIDFRSGDYYYSHALGVTDFDGGKEKFQLYIYENTDEEPSMDSGDKESATNE